MRIASDISVNSRRPACIKPAFAAREFALRPLPGDIFNASRSCCLCRRRRRCFRLLRAGVRQGRLLRDPLGQYRHLPDLERGSGTSPRSGPRPTRWSARRSRRLWPPTMCSSSCGLSAAARSKPARHIIYSAGRMRESVIRLFIVGPRSRIPCISGVSALNLLRPGNYSTLVRAASSTGPGPRLPDIAGRSITSFI